MSRKRGENTKDLPPNLYIRKGIYYYRDIRDNKEYSLGKNKSLAVTEAIQANIAIFKPKVSLIDRINNIKIVTLHEWLDSYYEIINKRGLSANSIRDYKSKISIIKTNLDDIDIKEITTKSISDLINNYPKLAMAKKLRATLLDAFNEAIASGLINSNPVVVTKAPKTKVQRARLTLEQFNIALNAATDKYKYLFLLAVLTGQRIGDLVTIKWSDINNGKIYIEQSKTGAKIAIPLDLKLNAIDCSINDVLNKIPHSTEKISNVSEVVLRNNFSKCLPACDNKPTFHEIRSLSARLYEDEKGVEFVKKLLGHKSMVMTDKYLDNRSNDYIEL